MRRLLAGCSVRFVRDGDRQHGLDDSIVFWICWNVTPSAAAGPVFAHRMAITGLTDCAFIAVPEARLGVGETEGQVCASIL
jgi:hypothetical protein